MNTIEGPSVHVEIFDTTMRDGAQALPEGNQFSEGSKVVIAEHIARLGVGVIEAGFPATPSDGEEVAAVAESVGRQAYDVAHWRDGRAEAVRQVPVIAGLSRTTEGDIEATWKSIHSAIRPRIHTFVSTDDEHMRAKFPGKTPDEVRDMGIRAVSFARAMTEEHDGASVEFSAEAASTTNRDYLERIIKDAVGAGADVINVPDTVGQRDPFFMYQFYRNVIRWVTESNPDVAISAHNHNDLDNAAANSLALVRAAADHATVTQNSVKVQIETAICGLGERAGNADVFPVVAGLFKFAPDYVVPTNWHFNPRLAVATARAVMGQAGLPVDRQSPIVGEDTNVHRSGIHSDGVIKGGHRIYTPHDPTFWGHSKNAVHEEGKYQGKAGRAAAQVSG